MPIKVSGKNIEMGESLKNFITLEIQKMADQYIGEFIDAHALMNKANGLFSCELDIHIARGFTLRSSGQDPDPYIAVTQAMTILKQRTKRYKARLRSMERHRKDASSLSRFVLADSQEEEKVQESPLIIAEMPDTLDVMSVGDAVMQLDLSEFPVFVFKNIVTEQLNVVYKRSDKNIGWIAPKS